MLSKDNRLAAATEGAGTLQGHSVSERSVCTPPISQAQLLGAPSGFPPCGNLHAGDLGTKWGTDERQAQLAAIT